MRSAFCFLSQGCRDPLDGDTYTSVLGLEAFSLPDWHIDGVYSIADSCHNPRDDHLHALGCRCLQNGPDHHDPASPSDTTFPTISIGSQESDDCTNETAEVVYTSDNAFELSAWVVKVGAK